MPNYVIHNAPLPLENLELNSLGDLAYLSYRIEQEDHCSLRYNTMVGSNDHLDFLIALMIPFYDFSMENHNNQLDAK